MLCHLSKVNSEPWSYTPTPLPHAPDMTWHQGDKVVFHCLLFRWVFFPTVSKFHPEYENREIILYYFVSLIVFKRNSQKFEPPWQSWLYSRKCNETHHFVHIIVPRSYPWTRFAGLGSLLLCKKVNKFNFQFLNCQEYNWFNGHYVWISLHTDK